MSEGTGANFKAVNFCFDQGSDVTSCFESQVQMSMSRHSMGTKESNPIFQIFLFETGQTGLAVSLVLTAGVSSGWLEALSHDGPGDRLVRNGTNPKQDSCRSRRHL
jgi:hypothetical protein